jgi:hypothetical protein
MMPGVLLRAFDRFRGAGDAAVAIPSLDGAFRPNQRLEEATLVLSVPAPDNLVAVDGRLLFSSGAALYEFKELSDGGARANQLAKFESYVTSVAAHVNGGLAVGLSGGGVVVQGGAHGGQRLQSVGTQPAICPTALWFIDEDRLVICLGSQVNVPSDWKQDLLQRNFTGSAWIIDLRTGNCTCLAEGLAWPNGILGLEPSRFIVAESWRHQLVELDGGRPKPVLSDLPGYPARLSSVGGGGYWLPIFAPRSQLVEFVLREPRFRDEMMRTIDQEFWVAPSLHPTVDYREPLQSGAIKQLGELKPWSPSRSYGLIARLDDSFNPIWSLHSRANGKRHGITSCVEFHGRFFASSKGGNVIIELDRLSHQELGA